MNKKVIVGVLMAAALGLAGCSTPVPAAPGPVNDGPTGDAAATAPAVVQTPTPKATPSSKIVQVKFGETIEYKDGIKIVVAHKETAVGSTVAAPAEARGAEVQVFEITLTNGTAEPLEPVTFQQSVVYGAKGVKAEKVYDVRGSSGIGNFTGVMVPGAVQTVEVTYLIPTADLPTVVMTVAPDYKYTKSIVTGGF
jgi:hypothetical protein